MSNYPDSGYRCSNLHENTWRMDPLQRVQSIDIGFVDGPMLIKKLLTKNQYVINGVIDGIKKGKKERKKYHIGRVFPRMFVVEN